MPNPYEDIVDTLRAALREIDDEQRKIRAALRALETKT